MRFVLPEEDEADAVTEAVRELAPHRVARIAAFQPAGHDAVHISDAKSTRMLRTALQTAGVSAYVVGGTRSHFTELNREPSATVREHQPGPS